MFFPRQFLWNFEMNETYLTSKVLETSANAVKLQNFPGVFGSDCSCDHFLERND